MTPAFSIVVPAYNAERTLASALASVDRQVDRDFEVVIVDDGSADATLEVAERLAHPRGWRVVHQANAGPSAARNAGLRAARGRWIALLDADDWYLPGYLSTMRRLLTGGPDVGLAFVDAWAWDEARRRFLRRSASGPYRPRPLPRDRWAFFEALTEANFVFVAAAAPRTVLEAAGGFDESLRAAEDWELWLRLAAAGRRMAGSGDRQAVYRHSAGQASRDRVHMLSGAVQALRGVRRSAELPPDVAARLDRRIARAERDLAAARTARPGARTLKSRAIDPVRPLRDFRLWPPRAVAAALPELVGAGPR